MQKSVQLAVLTGLMVSQGAMADGAMVIYGKDDRVEVSEASAFEQKLSSSAATMISKHEISIDITRPGVVQLSQKSLKEWLEEASAEEETKRKEKLFTPSVLKASAAGASFCSDTRFIEQPNPGMCSGFLIAPDLILTAGHCVTMPTFCSEFKWVFGFQVDPLTKKAGVDVKEDDVYSCKKVISNALHTGLDLDYAIVQLDRRVVGREPLDIRNDTKVEDNSDILVIGSPSGLPLKVAGGAKVRGNNNLFSFSANLDAFQGNSGSAVFNAKTGMVEGILVRGEEDFVPDMERQCIKANECADDKCRGEDVTRLTAIPEIGVQVALNSAAEAGDTKTLEQILKLNLWVDFYGKDGQSALIKAAIAGEMESIRTLITKGADINLKDAKGNTAAHYAAMDNNKKLLTALISAGSDKNLKNNEGDTIVSVLLKKGKKKTAKLVEAL